MDSIISYVVTEYLVIPLFAVMALGLLIVPFATPLISAVWIFHVCLGRLPLLKTPITFLLMLFGLGITVGVWFVNPDIETIDKVVNRPLTTLGLPCLALLPAFFEVKRAKLTPKWRKAGYSGIFLSALALYWMALSASLSAMV